MEGCSALAAITVALVLMLSSTSDLPLQYLEIVAMTSNSLYAGTTSAAVILVHICVGVQQCLLLLTGIGALPEKMCKSVSPTAKSQLCSSRKLSPMIALAVKHSL